MDIQTRKIEFVQEFLKLQNEELLLRLEKLLHAEKLQKLREFREMSIEELNNRIDKSLEDSESERVTKSGDLISEIKRWGLYPAKS